MTSSVKNIRHIIKTNFFQVERAKKKPGTWVQLKNSKSVSLLSAAKHLKGDFLIVKKGDRLLFSVFEKRCLSPFWFVKTNQYL